MRFIQVLKPVSSIICVTWRHNTSAISIYRFSIILYLRTYNVNTQVKLFNV